MNTYKKIVLIGMRGSGKSHFASYLSENLGWPKIDIDEEIENFSGKTIPGIIQTQGWDAFRDLEFQITKKVSRLENVIISTGGGTIVFERNRRLLRKNSLIVFLFASAKELYSRLKDDVTRPKLKDGKTLEEEIYEVWKERGEIYFENADIVFRARDGFSEIKKENVERNAKILAKKIKNLI